MKSDFINTVIAYDLPLTTCSLNALLDTESALEINFFIPLLASNKKEKFVLQIKNFGQQFQKN